MAPLIPRFHVFEIDDQPWFPPFLRAKVQGGLTAAWSISLPYFQPSSAARIVARVLSYELGSSVHDHVFIDFCAGGGGPTPSIEKILNGEILKTVSNQTVLTEQGYANAMAKGTSRDPVRFVLTDLHPHEEFWRWAARESPNIGYEPRSVDAAAAPADLVPKYTKDGKKVFRLFNLAFHHFDDPLARAILKNTVETSDGFGIFELQERNIPSFFTIIMFGIGIMVTAPYFAWKWRSLMSLFFVYVIPIIPFVLVFDGWMSCLRTRTPDEVEALLRTCGADPKEIARWEVRSGRELHTWPTGYLSWVICIKK